MLDDGKCWEWMPRMHRRMPTFHAHLSVSHCPGLPGWTAPGLVALEAHSAGGLTAGALLNRRAGDLGAALLEAPFVDVLTAMSDASLPLTVHEYEEWGDPRQPDAFERVSCCIRSGLRCGGLVAAGDGRSELWPSRCRADSRCCSALPRPAHAPSCNCGPSLLPTFHRSSSCAPTRACTPLLSRPPC